MCQTFHNRSLQKWPEITFNIKNSNTQQQKNVKYMIYAGYINCYLMCPLRLLVTFSSYIKSRSSLKRRSILNVMAKIRIIHNYN